MKETRMKGSCLRMVWYGTRYDIDLILSACLSLSRGSSNYFLMIDGADFNYFLTIYPDFVRNCKKNNKFCLSKIYIFRYFETKLSN